MSTNNKCTQPCYFPLPLKPAAQKLKKIWSTSIWCSRWAITTGRLPIELWCHSTTMSLRVIDLVFCKTLFNNKYFILWHWLFCIHFLDGMCVNLIPGHTYYEYSVWVLKLGMPLIYALRLLRLGLDSLSPAVGGPRRRSKTVGKSTWLTMETTGITETVDIAAITSSSPR
jgi:hypothetical protein